MLALRYRFIKLCGSVFMFFARAYVKLLLPWTVARFYSAWEEYQQGAVYRERLINFGFEFAFGFFFKSKWEQNYHLKNRFVKEPGLARRIRWMPWSVETPAVLETASRSGLFRQWAG